MKHFAHPVQARQDHAPHKNHPLKNTLPAFSSPWTRASPNRSNAPDASAPATMWVRWVVVCKAFRDEGVAPTGEEAPHFVGAPPSERWVVVCAAYRDGGVAPTGTRHCIPSMAIWRLAVTRKPEVPQVIPATVEQFDSSCTGHVDHVVVRTIESDFIGQHGKTMLSEFLFQPMSICSKGNGGGAG